MQWDGGPGLGFTTGTPWLPLGDPAVTVAGQIDDPDSLLTLYRRLIRLRKGSDALRFGGYRPLADTPAPVFAYVREAVGERLLVALNFSGEPQTLLLPPDFGSPRLALSTHGSAAEQERAGVDGTALHLLGDEGVIARLV